MITCLENQSKSASKYDVVEIVVERRANIAGHVISRSRSASRVEKVEKGGGIADGGRRTTNLGFWKVIKKERRVI